MLICVRFRAFHLQITRLAVSMNATLDETTDVSAMAIAATETAATVVRTVGTEEIEITTDTAEAGAEMTDRPEETVNLKTGGMVVVEAAGTVTTTTGGEMMVLPEVVLTVVHPVVVAEEEEEAATTEVDDMPRQKKLVRPLRKAQFPFLSAKGRRQVGTYMHLVMSSTVPCRRSRLVTAILSLLQNSLFSPFSRSL